MTLIYLVQFVEHLINENYRDQERKNLFCEACEETNEDTALNGDTNNADNKHPKAHPKSEWKIFYVAAHTKLSRNK